MKKSYRLAMVIALLEDSLESIKESERVRGLNETRDKKEGYWTNYVWCDRRHSDTAIARRLTEARVQILEVVKELEGRKR